MVRLGLECSNLVQGRGNYLTGQHGRRISSRGQARVAFCEPTRKLRQFLNLGFCKYFMGLIWLYLSHYVLQVFLTKSDQ